MSNEHFVSNKTKRQYIHSQFKCCWATYKIKTKTFTQIKLRTMTQLRIFVSMSN